MRFAYCGGGDYRKTTTFDFRAGVTIAGDIGLFLNNVLDYAPPSAHACNKHPDLN
jgi:hypothetical protein